MIGNILLVLGLSLVVGGWRNGAQTFSEKVAATWVFERGLPARIKGPDLNAKTGEVAIEELHIAHEGLRLVV